MTRSRADSQSRTPLFEGYEPLDGTFDEFFGPKGSPHRAVGSVVRRLNEIGRAEFKRRQKLANTTFLKSGVTFSVYTAEGGTERIFPFDLIPRIVSAGEWIDVERGLVQRIQALNLFLSDVYGDQKILEEGVVPRHLVEGSKGYRANMRGIRPPGGVYIHIAGVDLIRGADGGFLVLEDNVRVPSGVSYVLENREMMKKIFPSVFRECAVAPIETYPTRLREAMNAVAPGEGGQKRAAVLTAGPYNSAYFEHSFLARRIGCELVQGSDLFVEDDRVYAKTTHGPSPVDVIYRRIDDDFIDPEVFRADSALGIPGIMRAWQKGQVAIANAPGSGVADDKVVYAFVPEMIRYYLNEKPLIQGVKTYVCADERDRAYVLDHIAELVVKPANASGGYGLMVGPHSSAAQHRKFAALIEENPRNYIAQPTLALSTAPTFCGGGVAPRHLDLRPFILQGRESWVTPGGLTRVAMKEGSLVVNSSQGGGSKDTWIVDDSR